MVISEQFVEEVDRLRRDKVLIFCVDEALPALTRMSAGIGMFKGYTFPIFDCGTELHGDEFVGSPSEDVVEPRVENDAVFLRVFEQLFCA